MDVGVTLTEDVPVPVNGRLCGLPPPLSVTVTAAVRAPIAVGSNVTLIVQLFFGPKEVPQVLVSAKSVEFVPVIARPVIEIVLPAAALVKVMTCAALVVPTVCAANVKLVGEYDVIVPTPVTATVCAPPGALS